MSNIITQCLMRMQDAIFQHLKGLPFSNSSAIVTVTIPQNLAANALFRKWGPILARAHAWPSWDLVHAFEKSFGWEPGKVLDPIGKSIIDSVPGGRYCDA